MTSGGVHWKLARFSPLQRCRWLRTILPRSEPAKVESTMARGSHEDGSGRAEDLMTSRSRDVRESFRDREGWVNGQVYEATLDSASVPAAWTVGNFDDVCHGILTRVWLPSMLSTDEPNVEERSALACFRLRQGKDHPCFV